MKLKELKADIEELIALHDGSKEIMNREVYTTGRDVEDGKMTLHPMFECDLVHPNKEGHCDGLSVTIGEHGEHVNGDESLPWVIIF